MPKNNYSSGNPNTKSDFYVEYSPSISDGIKLDIQSKSKTLHGSKLTETSLNTLNELGQHQKQSITTGNGVLTTFAMDLNASQNSLLVVYGNVIQEPGAGKAYTVTGQNITFTSPPASGTSLYIIYLGQELTSITNPTIAEVNTLATTIAQTEAAALAIALGG